ncbi:MAG TPA: FeoB-associated Cys-rich membrane protein [Pyrinomonadaceae bacterium]|jgi:hypothetical protein
MFDWQNLTVALIILAACLYTVRRAWRRVRSMRGGQSDANASTCATGCGNCGDDAKTTAMPAKVLVQIGRSPGTGRRASRRRG